LANERDRDTRFRVSDSDAAKRAFCASAIPSSNTCEKMGWAAATRKKWRERPSERSGLGTLALVGALVLQYCVYNSFHSWRVKTIVTHSRHYQVAKNLVRDARGPPSGEPLEDVPASKY
jgi:hypothetical protein